ncbi:hypothetical protein CRG98_009837 [Punica granatum]|uniref:Gfo/Idh/MocA-like oxidoreductase N-terminal domain-containing protein n=1 Tax=Punica granatum TaxID=22663 RepID=A0A2I0KNA1_PUNGR|nr:hypothetical protein CRG98_009837 [Punica granatum]
MAERSDPIIKFGILGCNSVARLCRAISSAPSATLHAIAGHSLDEATSCALGNGFTAKLYGSYEELLGDREVEAVYVPLPTSLHARWAAEAARRGKHVLVEKPPALDAEALGEIIAACEGSGMHATFTFNASPNFLENDVRVKPDLDALGALGDAGWYCIRSILWATDYKLPKTVTALPGIVFNEAGVIMSCGASLHFEDDLVSTFRCSFLSHLTMDIIANGSKGSLHVYDYALPFQETQASYYTNSRAWFLGGLAGWGPAPVEHTVTTDLPQVVLMVEEFCRLVRGIKRDGLKPEAKWPAISMKTQLVLDKVKLSIERGYVPVEVLDG